jgi:protein required for attachment to host cells
MLRQIWILAAHRAGAKLFSADYHGKVKMVREWEFPRGHLRNRDINADRAGSMNGPGGLSHSPLEKELSPVDHESNMTAQKLARELEALHEKDHECRIALIANPRFLGRLRSSLNKSTLNAVAYSMPLDLARESDDKICERIRNKIAINPAFA